MDTKETIIQALEETPAARLDQVLSFLRFLKAQQAQDAIEDQQNLEHARAALAEAEIEGTGKWYFVRGREKSLILKA